MNITARARASAHAGSLHACSRGRGSVRPASSRLRRRLSSAVLVAVAWVALAHPCAALMPLPPMPVRHPVADICRMILTVAEEYADAPFTNERRVHNEIQLTLKATRPAI